MKTTTNRWASVAADILILGATVWAATWVAISPAKQVEAALRLESFEMPDFGAGFQFNATPEQVAERTRPLREKYAKVHPWSPISWVNRSPTVVAIEKATAKLQAASLPFLAVASVGVGLVAIRKAGPRPGRRRWGVGTVSAAIAMGLCGLELGNEFILRHWNLSGRGDLHYELANVWIVVLQDVGPAMLAAWSLLLVSGRFRLGGGWRGWLGFGLGLAWVLAYGWQLVEPMAQVYG